MQIVAIIYFYLKEWFVQKLQRTPKEDRYCLEWIQKFPPRSKLTKRFSAKEKEFHNSACLKERSRWNQPSVKMKCL